jgi:hypothetical protein
MKPKFNLPHPAIICSGPQLLAVIEGLENGAYPQPEDAIWRDDLEHDLAVRLALATGATRAQIAEVCGCGPKPQQTAPHIMVTWSNAISIHGRESECFADRDEAYAAAADGRRPWNNTRVDMCWHEPHDRSAARRARADAHHKAKPVHVWGITCSECAAISADRDASDAEVQAARDAAGDQHLPAVTS